MADRSRDLPARKTPQVLAGHLRRAIVAGEYRPKQQLVEDRLAAQFGTSRVPVREALRILEGEGLVNIRPYAGTFVASLTDRDAEDLLEIRGALEPLAAARAATLRTADQLVDLRAALESGFRAIDAGTLEALPELNATFHGILITASGNRTLQLIMSQLQDKINWVYSVGLSRRAVDSWSEHRLILDAVERGDVDVARALMHAHIRSAEAAYRLRDGVPSEDPEVPPTATVAAEPPP